MNPDSFTLKSAAELDAMRASGKILASVLSAVSNQVEPGTQPDHLDEMAESIIREAGAIPSFKGYNPFPDVRPFPSTLCVSINDAVVHGIPSKEPLKEGDMITVDVGVSYDGMLTDAAWTFPVGNVSSSTQRLLNTTRIALTDAIDIATIGHHVGDIGHVIQTKVEQAGFFIIHPLGGHGVGHSIWESPHIPNHGRPGTGFPLPKGATFAIEPIVGFSSSGIQTDDDGWTIRTNDGGLSAHFEHTLAITDNGTEVLTQF